MGAVECLTYTPRLNVTIQKTARHRENMTTGGREMMQVLMFCSGNRDQVILLIGSFLKTTVGAENQLIWSLTTPMFSRSSNNGHMRTQIDRKVCGNWVKIVSS